jgi:maltose-binding protein MalE
MKKLLLLVFAAVLTAGALVSCTSSETKVSTSDSSGAKMDTVVVPVPVDTSKVDTGTGKPIVPPNTKN